MGRRFYAQIPGGVGKIRFLVDKGNVEAAQAELNEIVAQGPTWMKLARKVVAKYQRGRAQRPRRNAATGAGQEENAAGTDGEPWENMRTRTVLGFSGA